MFAGYAVDDKTQAQKRIIDEPDCFVRTDFQRDKDRIICSNSFRRLSAKTQVFIAGAGDHYRNRLTHTIEVAHISRTLANTLGSNPTLAEAIALAHDLGHSPFGHEGERILNMLTQEFGGFNHNIHTIKLVMYLEKKYARFDGLNLTVETLNGIIKHNGPVKPDDHIIYKDFYAQTGASYEGHASIEAQSSAIADDIAYICHDIEDGMRAKFITMDQLYDLPLLGNIIHNLYDKFPNLEERRCIHEALRTLKSKIVQDVVHNAKANIKKNNIQTMQDIQLADSPMVDFSSEYKEVVMAIRQCLTSSIYTHPDIVDVNHEVKRIISGLFEYYISHPNALPDDWGIHIDHYRNQALVAEHVTNFIAGMTDTYAINCYKTLHGIDTKQQIFQ